MICLAVLAFVIVYPSSTLDDALANSTPIERKHTRDGRRILSLSARPVARIGMGQHDRRIELSDVSVTFFIKETIH